MVLKTNLKPHFCEVSTKNRLYFAYFRYFLENKNEKIEITDNLKEENSSFFYISFVLFCSIFMYYIQKQKYFLVLENKQNEKEGIIDGKNIQGSQGISFCSWILFGLCIHRYK